MRNSLGDKEGAPGHLARPEHALLLCCARTRLDAETAARLKALLAERLDWEYLLRLARRHSLLPLLYWQLNAHAPGAVPPARLHELKQRFFENAARNLLMAGELTRVLARLGEAGVPALAYKGPALAVSAYGDLLLRRFVDLDVLVPRRDVLRAQEILVAAGYRPQPELDPARQSILLRTQHSVALAREGGRLVIELHWQAAAGRFASDTEAEGFLESAETVRLNGVEVRSPSAERLLPALCVHGSKHFWERLAWICDVAELIRSHPGLDWPSVLRRSAESGGERMLFLGLRLASDLLGAPLPEEVRRRVESDAAAAKLAREVTARIFDGCEYVPVGLLGGVRFNLRARTRWREKIGYFRFIFAPTDGDLSHVRLPPRLSFVYYLLRPFRLLLKGGDGH
jgi:hypothetical protein